MEKILILEKRGTATEHSGNVGNCRVTAFENFVKGKDGNLYHLEFSIGRKFKGRQKGKEIYKNCLHLTTYMHIKNSCSCGNLEVDKNVWDRELEYSIENILKVTNEISFKPFEKIEFTN